MTAKEIQKRNAKAENLRVLQADDGSFYVESEKGKILYNVILDDEESSCTCGDFEFLLLSYGSLLYVFKNKLIGVLSNRQIIIIGAVIKSPAIGFDKFQRIGNQLK